uniref:acid phosphatase n=1 Tax=Timema poppense TaxID=170557 RepID=A0A7R9CPY7_TIMPO|nr:unnamed protein product [Timema poppensis]
MLVLGGGMLPDREGDFFLAVCAVANAVRPLLVSKKVGSMKLVVACIYGKFGSVCSPHSSGGVGKLSSGSLATRCFVGDGFEYVMGTSGLFALSHNNLKYSMKQFNTAITDASRLANLVDPRFLGPLLEEMVSNMKKKSENRLIPDRKMFVYSGHDTTVANFLNTLGVFDPQCPPYDALVLIELRQNSAGKYFVSYFSSHPPLYEKDTKIFVWNCALHSDSDMVFDCCAHAHIGGEWGGRRDCQTSTVYESFYHNRDKLLLLTRNFVALSPNDTMESLDLGQPLSQGQHAALAQPATSALAKYNRLTEGVSTPAGNEARPRVRPAKKMERRVPLPPSPSFETSLGPSRISPPPLFVMFSILPFLRSAPLSENYSLYKYVWYRDLRVDNGNTRVTGYTIPLGIGTFRVSEVTREPQTKDHVTEIPDRTSTQELIHIHWLRVCVDVDGKRKRMS